MCMNKILRNKFIVSWIFLQVSILEECKKKLKNQATDGVIQQNHNEAMVK